MLTSARSHLLQSSNKNAPKSKDLPCVLMAEREREEESEARVKCRGTVSAHAAEGTKMPSRNLETLLLDESHCLLF